MVALWLRLESRRITCVYDNSGSENVVEAISRQAMKSVCRHAALPKSAPLYKKSNSKPKGSGEHIDLLDVTNNGI